MKKNKKTCKSVSYLSGPDDENRAGAVHGDADCRLFRDGQIPIHCGVCRHENVVVAFVKQH